jgi:SsrA-binding protein
MAQKKEHKHRVEITNRKAKFNYILLDFFTAGIALTGTEIKSVRKSAINLKDSFCKIEDNEIFLYNCHISPYEQGNRYNHEAERTRKLLLTKKEILKMQNKVKQDGYTIVPLEVYILKGFAKIQIGLAKGKKLHDKRDALAKKDQQREMDRASKIKW